MRARQRLVWARTALALTGATILAGCATGDWFQSPFGSQPQSQPAQNVRVPAGFYRVNPGDTLPGVASAFGQSADQLALWNNLPRTAMLTPGQVLRVAPPPGAAAGTNVNEPIVVRPAWPAYGQVVRLTGDAGNTKGILITGRPDEPVKASADGNVIYVGTGIDRYKSLVVVKHGGDVVTGYAINGEVFVKEGDAVKQGQLLAQMGTDTSGRGTVEFEIRRAGKPVDPLALLPR
ncbi:murein hydrolase activator EnvC family protein [Trinickia diaoshuihuensis]|uniref:murein hydrolase activator EnvC family protein n=1 Tax=Trinickia diaoshuihuensis TaxID=2292265 RepID=UPI000E22CFC4|nr:peptidoglycan DD-metalloendopeptidase family protein [Trinickia diaoshuihuensis]